jgi:hypothetical protein
MQYNIVFKRFVSTLVLCVCAIAAGCQKPVHWQYVFHNDSAGSATLDIVEPKVTIICEGLTLGGGQPSSTGFFQIAGQGSGNSSTSFGDVKLADTYKDGVENIDINNFRFTIKESGKVISYGNSDFDIQGNPPLILILDKQGKISKEKKSE